MAPLQQRPGEGREQSTALLQHPHSITDRPGRRTMLLLTYPTGAGRALRGCAGGWGNPAPRGYPLLPALPQPRAPLSQHPAPRGPPTPPQQQQQQHGARLGGRAARSCLGERGGRLVTSLPPSSSSEREEGPTQPRYQSWGSLCLPQTEPKGWEPPPPGAGDISPVGMLPARRRGCHHLPPANRADEGQKSTGLAAPSTCRRGEEVQPRPGHRSPQLGSRWLHRPPEGTGTKGRSRGAPCTLPMGAPCPWVHCSP